MITEKTRKKIIAHLSSEPSDQKLAQRYKTSRKTVWRLRKEVMGTVEPEPETEKMQEPVVDSTPVPSTIKILDSVMPKVDAEPVVLATYFALQAMRGESYTHVAKAVMEASEKAGVLFRKLQVMDVTSIGGTQFIRFRSDLTQAQEVLQTMPERAHVVSDASGNYVVRFASGRTGKYPSSLMNTPPKLGLGRVLAGTRIRNWGRQFENL